MTTTPIPSALRATLKRLINSRAILLINTNGDLTDIQTHISLNPGTPRGTWHAVRSHDSIKKLLSADEITISDTGVTVRSGARTDDLDTEALDKGHDAPAMDAEAPTLTLRSDRGCNLTAIKVLASTASTDDTMPHMTTLHVNGNTADDSNTGDNADRHMVTGETTDRYQATTATLEADTADVDTLVAPSFFREAAKRSAWTMCVTRDVTRIEFDDLGIVATAHNLSDNTFPVIRGLFPAPQENQASVCASPKALRTSLEALKVERNAPAMLTSDGTVYAEGTPEVPVPDAHSTLRGEASPVIAFNPTFLTNQFKAVGARWDDVLISWNQQLKVISLSYGRGIEGIVMSARPLTRPGESSEDDSAA